MWEGRKQKIITSTRIISTAFTFFIGSNSFSWKLKIKKQIKFQKNLHNPVNDEMEQVEDD